MISLPGSRSSANYMLVRALEPFMLRLHERRSRIVAPLLLDRGSSS